MTTGKLQIVEPLTATISAPGTDGTNPANVLTNDPKEVWISPAGVGNIELDFGAAVTMDSVFLGFTNADAAAQVGVYSRAAPGGAATLQAGVTAIRASDAKSTRSSILLRFSPVAIRYLLVQVSALSAPLQAGRIAAGLAFEASWDREWGSGRRPIDTAKVQPLLGGGFGVQPGARKAAYSWTFGDLTDAEVEQLWGTVYRVGHSSPLIVSEQDGATVGANEKLHYGLFQRLDQFERRDPNATKWALEIEEWI
jgi:hypothetical protein